MLQPIAKPLHQKFVPVLPRQAEMQSVKTSYEVSIADHRYYAWNSSVTWLTAAQCQGPSAAVSCKLTRQGLNSLPSPPLTCWPPWSGHSIPPQLTSCSVHPHQTSRYPLLTLDVTASSFMFANSTCVTLCATHAYAECLLSGHLEGIALDVIAVYRDSYMRPLQVH